MALQLYADGKLAYDSRLEHYKLLSLKTTEGLNKAGTAEFKLPCLHPAYNAFTSLRTVVTLYENNVLQFRGRVLYPSDDWMNCRTIVCEGERGFLQDASIRPYLYQDSPAGIFADALAQYNADVDDFKRFTLGEVTVVDANDYVRMESESAETFAAFFDKLVERCGGFITFSDDGNGGRAINWLAEIGTQSQQAIEFGSNLLTFSRSGNSPELATVVRPYGAKLEDGSRVNISSVTPDGADYIEDAEAVALRGRIWGTPTWDDVTEPANLLRKTEEWLAEHRLAISSLQLTGADLSKMDRSIGAYHVGDRIRVKSPPHKVDAWFQLTDRTTNWFDLAGGHISLGKTQTSLTGLDVAGDRQSASALDKVKGEITSNYKNDIAAAVTETTRTTSSLIQQSVDSILLSVGELYTSKSVTEELRQSLTAELSLLSDQILMNFTTTTEQITDVNGDMQTKFTELYKYISFSGGGIAIGDGAGLELSLDSGLIVFSRNGVRFGRWDGVNFYTGNIVVEVNERAQFGNFAYIPRSDGSLMFLKVGG